MNIISSRIRAYVADPSVSNHYGEWGALRIDQRREIRELCDVCDMFEKTADEYRKEIENLKADKEHLEIELQAMRNAANSYKSKVKTLEMDNAQLHSDIVNANQNFDHIKGLWEVEKEKVEKAKQKVINVCKRLQTAKAEIERLNTEKAKLHKLIPKMIAAAKSEAIKEFAERLKEKSASKTVWILKMLTTL